MSPVVTKIVGLDELLAAVDDVARRLLELDQEKARLLHDRRELLNELIEARAEEIEVRYKRWTKGDWFCVYCLAPFEQSHSGRKRHTCSISCRSRLSRWRAWARVGFESGWNGPGEVLEPRLR